MSDFCLHIQYTEYSIWHRNQTYNVDFCLHILYSTLDSIWHRNQTYNIAAAPTVSWLLCGNKYTCIYWDSKTVVPSIFNDIYHFLYVLQYLHYGAHIHLSWTLFQTLFLYIFPLKVANCFYILNIV